MKSTRNNGEKNVLIDIQKYMDHFETIYILLSLFKKTRYLVGKEGSKYDGM